MVNSPGYKYMCLIIEGRKINFPSYGILIAVFFAYSKKIRKTRTKIMLNNNKKVNNRATYALVHVALIMHAEITSLTKTSRNNKQAF